MTILTVFVFLAVWWLFRHSLRYQAPSVFPAIHWFLVEFFQDLRPPGQIHVRHRP